MSALIRAVQQSRNIAYPQQFGYSGGDAAPAINKAIQALSNVGGGVLELPHGDYLANSQIVLLPNVTIRGEPGSNGYNTTIARKSRIYAGTGGMTVLYTSARNISLRDIAVDGMGIADKAFWADGSSASLAYHNYESCDFINAVSYSMHLQSTGLVRAHNVHASSALKVGICLDGYCGDSDWSNIYVNTNDVDNPSVLVERKGVGVWIGSGSNNLNWRGGKIEYNRVGIAVVDTQGVNISGVNFDVNRRHAIEFIENDQVADGANDPLQARSNTVTGCRFLGGEIRDQTNSAHIYAEFARGLVIVGNTFRRADDLAYDYNVNGTATQGPDYGLNLNGAERCIVTGNDFNNGGRVNCVKVYHGTPANAQHVFSGNLFDGTEDLADQYLKTVRQYGSIKFNGTWQFPMYLGVFAVWIDVNGTMRIKNGVPAADNDGAVIGTQVGP